MEVVCEGLGFCEGPVAMDDGSVLVLDVQGARLIRVSPTGAMEVLAETGGGPNGAAIGPDGAVWIANNGGAFFAPENYQGGYIQRFDLKSGELTTVYEVCDGARLIAPNDLVFDRHGGLWFTDHGLPTEDARRYGAVYYAHADGSRITRQRSRLLSPNGVGLSPDEDVVYMADTESGRLWAFDVVSPGQLAPEQPRVPGRLVFNLKGLQAFDSLAVEASGKVCAATIGQSGVTVIDPDGSAAHVACPDPLPTNICFGGTDMRDAWITGAGTGRLYKTRWDRPGLRLNFSA